MAIYSTFFLCHAAELPGAFPGWKLPLAVPVARTRINPFTREEVTITTREPEWTEADSNSWGKSSYRVVAISGDYETYLERRIPEFVQSQPHWCSKGLTIVELQPLVAAVTGTEAAKIDTALYAHPSVAADIEQLPDVFLVRMAAIDAAETNVVAQKWSKSMSTPEFTHSMSGERRYDDWSVGDALRILGPIVELAKQHERGQSMYLLVEG